jgi:sec-independent protein translocase protein TatB
MLGNLHGTELLLLLLLAVLLLGPDKLPEYAGKLARAVRALRDLAEGAKSQLKDEMGPAFDDVNWRALDPRQYDPRRIVRDALATPPAGGAGSTAAAPSDGAGGSGAAGPARSAPARTVQGHDPGRPTPFDADAT